MSKTMQVKKNFKFKNPTDEHIIKMKKNNYWWLLLLLLPFLLLIPIKKDVTVSLVRSFDNAPAANIPINYTYGKRDLFSFDSLAFFTNYNPTPIPPIQDTTDADGKAVFKDVKYSLYQWIFRNKDSQRVFVTPDVCYFADSTYTFWDKSPTLFLNYTLVDMQFTAVDADDNNEPIPNTMVSIKSDLFSLTDSLPTDAAGIVIFRDMPLCSNFEVIGHIFGWHNDTIKDNGKEIYQNQDTLFLRQQKAIVKFYVKDKFSKKAIVNIHGQLYFENNNTQIGQDAVTNVNGVGKGVFEKAHIVKKMHILVNNSAKNIFYNDTSTRDNMGYVRVTDWNKKSDEEKEIFLRPVPQQVSFKNIDCKTGEGLPNIENFVSINKAGSSSAATVASVFSNSNGEFSISMKLGDRVTIKSVCNAICPNRYLPNNSALTNILYDSIKSKPSRRKIRLCREPFPKAKFRNIDRTSGTGLAGVINYIETNKGTAYTRTSDSNGYFEINDVYECEIISIKADGADIGYGINAIKIKEKLYKQLLPPAKQEQRDIPMLPRKVCVTFINIDRCDKQPIKGITNKITLSTAGTIKKVSKTDGTFEICGPPEDLVSLYSSNKLYTIFSNTITGNKTILQLSELPQPIEVSMEMKGKLGKINFRVVWNQKVDVDFSVTDPHGNIIHSHENNNYNGTGIHDIDNTSGGYNSVENTYWKNPPSGEYKIHVQLHSGAIPANYKFIVSSKCNKKTFTGTIHPPAGDQLKFVGTVKYPFE